MTDKELRIKSIQYRIRLLRVVKKAKAGHTGGDLSCMDILNVLYNRVLNVSATSPPDPGRDRYIQSKGHSVEALYVVLADKGFFPESDLETLCQYRSAYVGHPTRKVRGIEHNTGALGHGLAFGTGVALAAKKDGLGYRVFVLMGDGELAEGLELGVHAHGQPLSPRQPDRQSWTATNSRSPAAPRRSAGWSLWPRSSRPSAGQFGAWTATMSRPWRRSWPVSPLSEASPAW